MAQRRRRVALWNELKYTVMSSSQSSDATGCHRTGDHAIPRTQRKRDMTLIRNTEQSDLFSVSLNIVAVVGLWLVACSIGRLPRCRQALDMI